MSAFRSIITEHIVITLKCQINGGPNKQGGQKKLPKFNKRGVGI